MMLIIILIEIRKKLGTGWNPEPMTQYQSGHLLKKERILTQLLAQKHKREDHSESIKYEIDNLRRENVHGKKVLKRYIKSIKYTQRQMQRMLKNDIPMAIEEIKQELIDIRKTDKKEDNEFKKKLFALRREGRVAHLENIVQKKNRQPGSISYAPSNVDVHKKGKFSKYLDEAKIIFQFLDFNTN